MPSCKRVSNTVAGAALHGRPGLPQRRLLRRAACLAVLAPTLVFFGCPKPRGVVRAIPPMAPPRASAELLAAVDRQFEVTRAYRAKVDMEFHNLATGEKRSASGPLRVARGSGMVLQVGKLGVTAFLLVANPERFWIDVPRRHRTYEAEASSGLPRFPPDKAFLNLRPYDIIEALSPAAVAAPSTDTGWIFEIPRSGYTLTQIRPAGAGAMESRPVRRIHLEAADLSVTSIETFDPDGALSGVARYGDRVTLGAGLFARRVEVESPADGIRLVFKLSDAGRLDPAGFSPPEFDVPPSRERVRLDEGALKDEDFTQGLK